MMEPIQSYPSLPNQALVGVGIDLIWIQRFPSAFASLERRFHPLAGAFPRSIEFPYCSIFDEGFSESMSAEYADTTVPGRAENYKTYAGTQNKQFTLTFNLMAECGDTSNDNTLGPYSYGSAYTPSTVVLAARWLEALTQPIYVNAHPVSESGTTYLTERSFAPPPVFVVVGALLMARCIIDSVEINWQKPWADSNTWNPATRYNRALFPHRADVTCSFTVVRSAGAVTQGNPYGQFGTVLNTANRWMSFQGGLNGY